MTASGNYVLFEGSEVEYASTSITVDYSINRTTDIFILTIKAVGATAGASEIGSYTYAVPLATIEAKSPTGTTSVDRVNNQVDQVVYDYLSAITENSGVTFTP